MFWGNDIQVYTKSAADSDALVLFAIVIVDTLISLKVSAVFQLRCRQRIWHFSGDNEIADLDITATENGQTVPQNQARNPIHKTAVFVNKYEPLLPESAVF